jgi:hypothetical protein
MFLPKEHPQPRPREQTRVVQENIDLPTLAALLGHASILMAQKYVHTPLPGTRRRGWRATTSRS